MCALWPTADTAVRASNSVEVDPATHDRHSEQHYRISVPAYPGPRFSLLSAHIRWHDHPSGFQPSVECRGDQAADDDRGKELPGQGFGNHTRPRQWVDG